MSLDNILLVPDVHRPFHDKRAWDVMIKAGKKLRPRYLVVLGDFSDCFALSAHDKDPRRLLGFKEEVKSAREGLEELESLGAEKKIFCQGNHEYRLDRYLFKKAPELIDLVSIQEAFQLKQNKWLYVPYMSHTRVGKLFVCHDSGHAGVHATHLTGAAFNHSVAFGHTHRLSVEYFGSVTGERHVAANLGWLGDVDSADYMPLAKRAGWQLGFGVGKLEKNGNVHLQPVPIVDGKAVIDGRLV